MTDIEDLQRRISAALQRIDIASDALGAEPGADIVTQLETAQAALSEEKQITTELRSEIEALRSEQARALADAQRQSTGQAEAMAQVDVELQRLRAVTESLRDNNRVLREANAAGLADVDLINASLSAELEALRAEREADVAEARAIIAAMTPLLEREETA